LRSVGAAAGLQVLLRNMEASAQGVVKPARLIVVHRPLGTVKWAFTPTSGSLRGSRVLRPFDDRRLSSDAITLSGVSTNHLGLNGGGAHEGGTVVLVTGVTPGGTRPNRAENDDAFAAGPSFDQVFLARSPALRPGPGAGYLNVACDARTDNNEISTRCLSYSTIKQNVTLYSGGTGQENVPLLPVLSPLTLYANVFSNFVPGGATAQNLAVLEKARAEKKSLLDHMLTDLRRLESLAPSSEKSVMDAHLAAIRAIETTLDASTPSECVKPPAPSPVSGKLPTQPNGDGAHVGGPAQWLGTDDADHVATVGRNHWAVIKAAFICDIVRVATFQLEPGTGHVGFELWPGKSLGPYRHHPVTHSMSFDPTVDDAVKPATVSSGVEFLIRVEEWFNRLVAELLVDFRSTTDSFGNNLLGTTVVPYLTEVRNYAHGRSGMPAVIFGGRDLGMIGNQFLTANFSINSVWGTIAQAFGIPATAPLAEPIAGLWAAPAP
jgi:hypothetical protein